MVEQTTRSTLEQTVRDIAQEAVAKVTKEAGEKVQASVVKEAITKSVNDFIAEGPVEQIAKKAANDTVDLITKHGDNAIKVFSVAPHVDTADLLLKTLDDDVLESAVKQGSDAIAALSGWSEDELRKHGATLVQRARKDANVLSDIRKLVESGPVDPQKLTRRQKKLINAIAENSTQNADAGQIVLGKWVNYDEGFTQYARATGSAHYNPHPDMWNLLEGLGQENREEVAWLVNQRVIQTGISKNQLFEYSLTGISNTQIRREKQAVELVFSGASDTEIMRTLRVNNLPIRIKEIQELQKSGYEFVLDEMNNSMIFHLP